MLHIMKDRRTVFAAAPGDNRFILSPTMLADVFLPLMRNFMPQLKKTLGWSIPDNYPVNSREPEWMGVRLLRQLLDIIVRRGVDGWGSSTTTTAYPDDQGDQPNRGTSHQMCPFNEVFVREKLFIVQWAKKGRFRIHPSLRRPYEFPILSKFANQCSG